MNLTTDDIIAYEDLRKVNLGFEDMFKEKLSCFLDKGWYILGNEVAIFEENFARYCGARYCVGVANGLDALVLGLTALELPAKSEIIVPANTYIATILGIINAGHIPVLVEPDRLSCNLSASEIAGKITSNTRAIMVVHLYGQIAQMDEICSIAKEFNLQVIEDCAQAHGAVFMDKKAGTFGIMGAYSFYPTKNLGALGDAGAIITSDENLYQKLKALRNYGSEKKYYNRYIGFNSRLDELQAAFLNVKLPFLDKINSHKRELANLYSTLLTNEVVKPVEARNSFHVYHIYNIRTQRRDELREYLLKRGIHTEIHYPVPPNRQDGYTQYFKEKKFPISEEIHSTTLSLPVSYATSVAEVKMVSAAINQFFA